MPAATTKTLKVICPICLTSEDTILLDLNDLNRCECTACGENFSAADAAAKFATQAERWAAVAKWVETAPTV